jgi:hypothetical protein
LVTVLLDTDIQNAVPVAKNIQQEGEPFKFIRAKSDASNFLKAWALLVKFLNMGLPQQKLR